MSPALKFEGIAVLSAWEALLGDQPKLALQLLDAVWPSVLLDERAWLVRVAALLQLGRPVDASGVAARALADLPQSLSLRVLFAVAAQQLGEPGLAETALRDALAIAPDHPLVSERLHALLANPMVVSPLPTPSLFDLLPVPTADRRAEAAGWQWTAPAAPPSWMLGQLMRPLEWGGVGSSLVGSIRLATLCAGAAFVLSGERVAGGALLVLAITWPSRLVGRREGR
jgi:hypothetical protein